MKLALYYWLLLAEGHLTRRLFRAMLRRIEALPAPAGQEATAAAQTGPSKEGGRRGV